MIHTETTFVGRWIANPRSLIAYSLLLGALAGTAVWFRFLAGGGRLSFWLVSSFVYYSFAGFAAVRLLKTKPDADLWAMAALIPQILQVQVAAMVFKIVCGLHATITLGGWNVNFSFGAESVVQVGMLEWAVPTRVAVNLVPLLLVSYLWHQTAEPPKQGHESEGDVPAGSSDVFGRW